MTGTDEAGPLSLFYWGNNVHPSGYLIEDIWEWDMHKLDRVQDYLAWLFPAHDRLQRLSNAPTLTYADLSSFQTNQELRARFLKSLVVMLGFYGLKLDATGGRIQIEPANDFNERVSFWVMKGDYHFRRISRILRSLSLLGCKEYSLEFINALRNIYLAHRAQIGYTILKHWRYSAFDLNRSAKLRKFGDRNRLE